MGSRSLQLGGNALQQAAVEVRTRLIQAAARLLEVEPSDLTITKGPSVRRVCPAARCHSVR